MSLFLSNIAFPGFRIALYLVLDDIDTAYGRIKRTLLKDIDRTNKSPLLLNVEFTSLTTAQTPRPTVLRPRKSMAPRKIPLSESWGLANRWREPPMLIGISTVRLLL